MDKILKLIPFILLLFAITSCGANGPPMRTTPEINENNAIVIGDARNGMKVIRHSRQ
ncbi:MAG: hypothetical protein OXC62_14830 [Aestuariivita sp.]|nr:hypothetical protein [Aestuariivita sp.]